MTKKFNVGDKVACYMHQNSPDYGVVIKIEKTINFSKIWAKWESDNQEHWFAEHEEQYVKIIQSVDNTEPKYSKETIKAVLIAYVKCVLKYNCELVSDEIIEKTFHEVNKEESDPEYVEYLRLKSKFETI
jgi:hypothetical protein